jgi:oxygen-independent coproporphyrinogen-3 oxidase
MADRENGELSLYIHWPFCLSKCPYCDFNSHPVPHPVPMGRRGIEQARWRAALLRELESFANEFLGGFGVSRFNAERKGRRLKSIFFGGGTPSLLAPATVEALIDRALSYWPPTPALEITLEANPATDEEALFAAFATAGVNRLSLGVQALEAEGLRVLGRRHSLEQAERSLERAMKSFPQVSIDLIYGRPGQTPEGWAKELERALGFGLSHLSAYQLTLEEGTPLALREARGDVVLPDEETILAFDTVTETTLSAAGLHAYEISNHARPGHASQHNLAYWRSEDYLGIGPGAHGRITGAVDLREGGRQRVALEARRAPAEWLSCVETLGHGQHPPALLDASARWQELLLMGLRLVEEGLPLEQIHLLTGHSLADWVPAKNLDRLIAGGFLTLDLQMLRTTPAGRRRLNAVLQALLSTNK